MTESQRLQIRMSETRQAANDPTTTEADRERLLRELSGLEVKYRTALGAETAQVDQDFAGRDSGESSELRALINRASGGQEFGSAFYALASNRHVPSGAVAELQEHRGLPGHLLPLDLFFEQRATLTGLADAPSQPQAFREYIFPAPVAGFMAFDFPRVSYGTPSFPVVTTPVTIHTPDEGADADETTGVIAAEALEPQRVQGALRYSREDAARFAALGDAVMRHVRAAYAAAVDGRCLTDTTAGLLSITEPADPGAEADFDDYIGVMIPDGRYSTNPSDVHLLVGNETAAHMAAEYKTNNSPTSAYAALLGLAGAGSMRVAHGRSWLTLW